MKTYYIFLGLLACIFISCSKNEPTETPENSNDTSDYAIVLQNGTDLNVQFVNATTEAVALNNVESTFFDVAIPDIQYLNGINLIQCYKSDNCNGILTKHDFGANTTKEIIVFEDLNDCEIEFTAIIESSSKIYISYKLNSANPATYWVRAIDKDQNFVDVELNKKPIDLSIISNKLYILTLDEQITDENSLSVYDIDTNSIIDEIGLGYDAKRIFKNPDGDLVVGYEELHAFVNAISNEISYVQYNEDFNPKFAFSSSKIFGNQNRLYYTSSSVIGSVYPQVASSFDFGSNTETHYLFEQLLTDEQLNDFEIKTSTSVNFDDKNDMILIGYEKTDGITGGLLRFKLNTFNTVVQIDNLNLPGIPNTIVLR